VSVVRWKAWTADELSLAAAHPGGGAGTGRPAYSGGHADDARLGLRDAALPVPGIRL